MKIVIERESIHLVEIDGIEKLQFEITFPEHLSISACALVVDMPATKQTIKEVIQGKIAEIQAQLDTEAAQQQRDNEIRESLGLGGTKLEFDL